MLLSSTFNADNVNDPGFQMLDNMTIDRRGRIVLQEDVGGNDRLGRVYVYGIDSGELVLVAQHNPKFFKPGEPGFLTNDEESSGVIDASRILGNGWFLMTVQIHKASATRSWSKAASSWRSTSIRASPAGPKCNATTTTTTAEERRNEDDA